MIKICIWTGTDALTLVTNPPGNRIWHVKLFFYRLKWKILKRLFNEHWVRAERIKSHLNRFGIYNITKIYPSVVSISLEKKSHEGINVLYYLPRPANLGGEKYINWCYGEDIITKLINKFPNINFWKVTGSSDMKEVYPLIDAYIRPSRCDGVSRMQEECRQLKIPYRCSADDNPKYEDYENFIKMIVITKNRKLI